MHQNKVESFIGEGTIKEKVIVQAGHTKYESKNMEIFDGWKVMDSTYVDTYKNVLLYSEKSRATASSTFDISNGKYYTFVHSCDFPAAEPATRSFYFNINGTKYLKQNTY